MGATPVCLITDKGCIRPDFSTCLAYFQDAYRGIYGQDVYLGADSQDGQFIALLANALHDANAETLAAYNAFSPASAQGAGLSSVVKINGIRRRSPTYSTVDVLIVGQVGSIITGGSVRDAASNLWNLPNEVIIPRDGQILVTATCRVLGSLQAAARSISTIATPTQGWQSVINPAAATAGLPVESDSALRQRQALSTALPAQTILESMIGALMAIAGVTHVRAYENDGNLIDSNGIPAHALSIVIEGGDVATIGQVIAAKKSPGVGTYGDTLQVLTDAYGISHPIRFFRSTLTGVAWYVKLRAGRGYTTDVEAEIKAALAAYTNTLDIGEAQQLSGAYPAANLTGLPHATAFEIVGLSSKRANLTNDTYGDVGCLFNERLTCVPEDVTIQVVS